MKKIICFIIFAMVIIFSNCCFAIVDIPEYIHVGLYSGTRGVSEFTILSESGMQIGTVNEDGEFDLIKKIKSNKKITVEQGENNSVYISEIGEIGDDENFLRIIPNESDKVSLLTVNEHKYRGEIEVRRFSNSDMTVINILPMQEYLYGVVPREIGGNSPMEALKAQAIIARTYAIKNYDKREKWNFNLTNTTDDQAYGGYDWENPNSNKAVDETEGMVATYNGELISGYYFSTSGGYTESSINVWGGDIDYLEAVPDPYENENLDKTKWVVIYTAEQIKELLAKRDIDIGDIKNMVVRKFSEAGRVLELEVIGTDDSYTLTKSLARTYLGLNSQWFTINDTEPEIPEYTIDEIYIDDVEIAKEEEVVADDEKSKEMKPLLAKLVAIFTQKEASNEIDESKDDDIIVKNTKYGARIKQVDTFEINGRGWGHSVGMSQNGAIGMANNDFSYEEIIKWYFKGVEIEG